MVFSPVVGCCPWDRKKNKQKWETIDIQTLSWHSQPSQVILLLDYKQSWGISSSDKATLMNEWNKARPFLHSVSAQTKLGHCTSHRIENTHFPTEWMMVVSVPGREMPLLSGSIQCGVKPHFLRPSQKSPSHRNASWLHAVCVLAAMSNKPTCSATGGLPLEGTDSAQHGPNVLIILSAYIFSHLLN